MSRVRQSGVVFDSVNHQREWFLNIALKDILMSYEPNYANSKWMTKDKVALEFESPYEYYVFAFNYANTIGVPAFDIVKTLTKSPKYFDYFLIGEEFDDLFRQYFASLSPEDVNGLIEITDALVEQCMRTLNSYKTVRNYVYLSRRLRGYMCSRVYGEDVDEEMKELESRVQDVRQEYDYDARIEYTTHELHRYNAQRLENGLEPVYDGSDEYEDVMEEIEKGFYGLIDAEQDTVVIIYAEYYDALVEEEPREEVVLL